MVLIIGGAYQGKREFAKAAFSLEESQIYSCHGGEIDVSYPCIDRLEEFTLACVRTGIDPIAYFQTHEALWQTSTLICQDIFCGVVPLEAELRQWRSVTGQLCQYLSKHAQRVSRVFCGLEQRLK